MTKDPIWISRKTEKSSADFWPTPSWVTKSLLAHETFSLQVWEPACGDGAIARVLDDNGYAVYSSDLHDRGYGVVGVDFLGTAVSKGDIITNPPFAIAHSFAEHAVSLGGKTALLLPLSFLEGQKRRDTLFTVTPPSRVRVLSKRVTFVAPGVTRKVSGTRPMAWFIWDAASSYEPWPPEIYWL